MNGTGDDHAKQYHPDITGPVRTLLFYWLSCDFVLRLTSLLCQLVLLWGLDNRRNWRGLQGRMRKRPFASSSLLHVNKSSVSSSCWHHLFVAPPFRVFSSSRFPQISQHVLYSFMNTSTVWLVVPSQKLPQVLSSIFRAADPSEKSPLLNGLRLGSAESLL